MRVGETGKGSLRNLDRAAWTHSRENLQHRRQHLSAYCGLACRHCKTVVRLGICCPKFRMASRPDQAMLCITVQQQCCANLVVE